MNQRDALRYAAGELLDLATWSAEQYRNGGREPQEAWTTRDNERVAAAFEVLADRLHYTATGQRRTTPAPRPADPDQLPLFEENP